MPSAAAPAQLPVDLANLPFLGARTDTHALFQYVITRAEGDLVEFSVPGWVALREHLAAGARMTFHLPFRAREDFFDEAEIIAARPDAEQGGQAATARLTGRSPLRYPILVAPSGDAVEFRDMEGQPTGPLELARAVLRDCALGKHGVRVYFKHLVPLFSRITLFPSEEYRRLRFVLLEEIRGRIEANAATFERWAETVAAEGFQTRDLAAALDLEALRAATEPEINNELFDAVFNTDAISQYLNAIRLIERRLCLNYNTLVLLYAAALRG